MPDVTDGQLVHQTQSGDHDAYRQLVARYQGHVYGLAYSLVGDWTQAQDIAQETFIRAYTNLGQLRDGRRFAAWLRRVAFSVAMNWLKAFRPGLFRELDGKVDLEHLEIPDFRPGPPEVAEKRELADAVLAAVADLPPKYRLPITMFHLDGLSYKKVADFLDIPLGTVKGLIHRARAKLKAALPAAIAKEMTPVVQEVFNEHKLSEEFAHKVLEGISELRWEDGDCMFAGAVLACMKFMKEKVTFDSVMGVSGCAFQLWWAPDLDSADGLPTIPLQELFPRTFKALGFGYEFLSDPRGPAPAEDEGDCRQKIVQSIDAGRPVIAIGVVGPPDCGVVAGYERDGQVLLGQSYFHDGSKGYYRKEDWYKDCHGLVLIGEKSQPLERSRILRDALEWAIQLARTPERQGCTCGLAAYSAWAEWLKCDGNFPAGDLDVRTQRCHISNSVTLSALRDARRSAAAFLREMFDTSGGAPPSIMQAAAAYDEETRLLDRAMELAPFCHESERRRLQMAGRGLRESLADHILQAGEKDRQAVEHLEETL